MHQEYVSTDCNLCGTNDADNIANRDRHGNFLSTVICKACGLIYTNPRPKEEDVTKFYEESYRINYKSTFTPKLKHIYRAGRSAINRHKIIKNIPLEGNKLLDIGSGGGEFLYLLKRFDFEAEGIEPNLGYASYATEEYGINLHIKSAQEIDLPANHYDLITIYHVLEHMYHPFEILQLMWRWLKPGGYAMIDVPNIASTQQTPKNKFHLAHLYNFNPKTLTKMCERAGFEVVEKHFLAKKQIICFVIRKIEIPNEIDLTMPDNFQWQMDLINKHRPFSHYFKLDPYARLLYKIYKAINELRVTTPFLTGKDLLDNMYQRYCDEIKSDKSS